MDKRERRRQVQEAMLNLDRDIAGWAARNVLRGERAEDALLDPDLKQAILEDHRAIFYRALDGRGVPLSRIVRLLDGVDVVTCVRGCCLIIEMEPELGHLLEVC